jgi:hypothetical protein
MHFRHSVKSTLTEGGAVNFAQKSNFVATDRGNQLFGRSVDLFGVTTVIAQFAEIRPR